MDLKESKNNTGSRHPWEASRSLIVQRLLKRKRFPIRSFLDLGSGDLFFSQEFCNSNSLADGFAVDIAFSDDLLEKVNNNKSLNLKVYNSIDRLQEELKEPVSVVFLMDVLEHIKDDRGFLQDLIKRSIVSSKTVFFITVPAFQSLFCSHDVFLEHFRRYNNKQLKSLLIHAGLSVSDIGYFYSSLIPPRMLKVFLERFSKNTNTDYSQLNHWKHGRFVSGFVRVLLMLDFHISQLIKLIGIKLPGLSNYAICQISA